MSSPRFFTDPLSGATWPYKSRLTSAQMNQVIAGLRAMDYAVEWNQAYTWPHTTTESTMIGKAVSFNRVTMETMLLMDVSSAATVLVRKYTPSGTLRGIGTFSAPAGGWTTTTYGISVSSPTVTIVGGLTPSASAQKIATYSTATETFTLRSTNNASANVGPSCGVWDATNGMFIVGFNGASVSIETSTNGQTWVSRTTPAVATPSAIATNGSGVTVALLSGSGSTAWRSTNGTSWSAVSMPASSTWSAITYSVGLGLWVASDGSANLATSTDGATWSAATLGGANAEYPARLASTKNLVLSLAANSIAVSEDGSTFRRALYFSAGRTVESLWASNDIALATIDDGTNTTLYTSPLFRVA